MQLGTTETSIILAAALLTSAISGRVTMLAARAGVRRPLDPLNAARDVLGIVAGLSFWLLLLWGLSSLDWYIVIPIALGAGMAGGIIANPPRWQLLYRFEPVVALFTLGSTGWLWVARWPY
ncbi:MAG TPA: hypothetical protein VF727_15795 [Allosphingosinicella sp.]|jgi:hypothetical protein